MLKDFKGPLIYTFFNSISKSITLFSAFILILIVGKENYGLYSHINMFSQLMGVVTTFGLGVYLNKTLSLLKDEKDVYLYNLIIIYLCFFSLIFLFLYLFSDYIIINFFNSEINFMNYILLMPVILFLSIGQIQSGYYLGGGDYKKAGILNLTYSMVLLFSLIVVYFFNNLSFYILSLILSVLNYFFVLIKNINIKKYKLKYLNVNVIKEILNFCIPVFFASLLFSPVIWYMNAKVLKEINNLGLLGEFNIAYQIRMIIFFLPSIMMMSSISKIVKKEKESRNKLLWKVFCISLLISVLIIIVFDIFRVIFLYYSSTELIDVKLVYYNYFIAILMVVNAFFGLAWLVFSKVWNALLFNLIWAVICILLNNFFIQKGEGVYSSIYALVIAYIALTILQFFCYLRVSK